MENSLLTNTEYLVLSGRKTVSKDYEYRIKSDIKKKIRIFQQTELPLLLKNGFINDE